MNTTGQGRGQRRENSFALAISHALMTNFQPDGWPTIIPRVFTEDVRGVVGFLKLVFGAHGEMRIGAPAKMRIGDSLILVSDGGPAREARKPSCMSMWRILTRPMDGRSREALLP